MLVHRFSHHYCLLTFPLVLELEFSGRSQRAEDHFFFLFVFGRKTEPMWCEAFYEMTKRLLCRGFLFAFSFLSYLVYASQYWSPAIVGDQGDFEVCCPITFLPHSHILSLCWCTVDNIQRVVLSFVGVRSIYQCSFLGYSTIYFSVLFFSRVKVSLWTYFICRNYWKLYIIWRVSFVLYVMA